MPPGSRPASCASTRCDSRRRSRRRTPPPTGPASRTRSGPCDGTRETGMDLLTARQLEDRVRVAVEHGWSVAIHAIGDRAVRSALDAFEAVRPRLASLALPPRIEHVQLLDPADRPRFAALG